MTEDKKQLFEAIDAMKEEVFSLGKRLFNTPELGFYEYETGAIAKDWLDQSKIPYVDGISLTGIQATLGEGDYHIALMADMDALLVPIGDQYRPFHSCGHSIQVAVMLAVMRALHASDLLRDKAVKVSLLLTPAEEFIDLERRQALLDEGKIRFFSGKQNMIADGVLDDIDCVLSCHVSGSEHYAFDVGSRLAGFTAKKVIFKGKAAHSGVAAHQGKNALHAAILLVQALSFLKDQFSKDAGVRLEPILTEGGRQMNVVPETAAVESYLRANTLEDLNRLRETFDRAATHMAGAIGVGVDIIETAGYLPFIQSEALVALLLSNMRAIVLDEQIERGVMSGASGDIGDVGNLLPSVQFGFSGIRGRVHSHTFSIEDPEHVYLDTAKVLLGVIADLVRDPTLRVRNSNFLKDKKQYLRQWLHF